MKNWFCITGIFLSVFSFAQEIPNQLEQQLEEQSRLDDTETEDDSYQQELEYFLKHPININKASVEDLRSLKMLNEFHINNLHSYRQLFGELIHIYELQAIPGWDLGTIRKILPYINVNSIEPLVENLKKRFSGGERTLLLRTSQQLERSSGFDNDSIGTKYLGSPARMMIRYRYNYKNLLRYGIIAEKDAGEQFFRGAQRAGFDFYSAHLFATRLGVIQQFALGDYTVNLGQGLIQWQGLAFGKSSEASSIKRQSPKLRPYNSSGEFNFYRGAGMLMKRKKISLTAFVSRRKLSANLRMDTSKNETYASSLLTGGYHRTSSEIEDRNRLFQTSFGGNVEFKSDRLNVGLNAVSHFFSLPIRKSIEPYNLYAIHGKQWWNGSLDYSYTFRNLHFFGELATDKNFHRAILNGMLISVDPRADLSFLYRSIAKEYQALYGNAFTENSVPSNETGFFMGLTIRPFSGWRINACTDVYQFPWLKYLSDAPSGGRDFLVQFSYTFGKVLEINSRYRNQRKEQNQSTGEPTKSIVVINRKSWRTQFNYKLNSTITLRTRVELLWHDHKGNQEEEGFLINADFLYQPMRMPMSASLRLQYFETDGYDSRIYAYENDILYSFSIPAFSDQGHRYYINLEFDPLKKLSVWLKWAQTIYLDKKRIGTGPDEINGNKKSEIKLQLLYNI